MLQVLQTNIFFDIALIIAASLAILGTFCFMGAGATPSGEDDSKKNAENKKKDKKEKSLVDKLKATPLIVFTLLVGFLAIYVILSQEGDFSLLETQERWRIFMNKIQIWNSVVTHMKQSNSFTPPVFKESYNVVIDLYEFSKNLDMNNPSDALKFYLEMEKPVNKEAYKIIDTYLNRVIVKDR